MVAGGDKAKNITPMKFMETPGESENFPEHMSWGFEPILFDSQSTK